MVEDGYSGNELCNMEWIKLAHDRDRWQAHDYRNEFSGSIKCREFLYY
jgi:hypothetical protein